MIKYLKMQVGKIFFVVDQPEYNIKMEECFTKNSGKEDQDKIAKSIADKLRILCGEKAKTKEQNRIENRKNEEALHIIKIIKASRSYFSSIVFCIL